MNLEPVNPGGTYAISGTAYNALLDAIRSGKSVFSDNGINVNNVAGSVGISNGNSVETNSAKITASVMFSVSPAIGFYRAKRLIDPANPQASAAVTAADFGTPTPTVSCIVENAAERRGSAPLPVDGSAVVTGRWSGFNLLSEGGVGTSDDDGLPVLQVDAMMPTTATVTVTTDGGSNGDTTTACSLTYSWTDPQGNSMTGTTPEAPQRPTVGYVKTATKGEIRYSGGVWSLWWCNECIEMEACS